MPTQVFLLTHSTLAVGLIALVQLVGILLFSLGGGAIADTVDRRRLLLITQLGLAGTSLGLALLALTGSPPVPAIYGLAFLAAAIGAVDQPARSSAIPRLVPTERLPAAIALGQLNFQAGSIIGPVFGGVLVATVGAAGAYLVDVATFGAAIAAVLLIRPIPPIGGLARPTIAAVREGLAFAAGHRVILSTFVVDLDAMIFGMPTSLFPALAIDVFRAGPGGVGFLTAAPAVGAFVAALSSGWVSRVRRPGRATLIAIGLWGVAIVGFGLSTFSFPLALVFLAIAGGADVLSAVFRSTILQVETPDPLRGRVTALHGLVVTSGPRLGDAEAASVAAVVGPQLSVVSGGLLCLGGLVLVARRFRELREYVSPAARPAITAEERPASAG
jgi:MFS family permease